jgi:predicted membrane protein
MRTLLKVLLFIIGAAIAVRVSGLVISKRLDEGSEVSDEFRRVVFLNGIDFRSRAGGLRNVQLQVMFGGAKLDLREATIGPAGARMQAQNTMGGLLVIVRDDWAVSVDDELIGGGDSQVEVTPIDELPADAPRLHIDVTTKYGGTVVSTRRQDW